MSYLEFEFKGTSESGKTKRWIVKRIGDSTILGWIEWKATWRRYWFYPTNGNGFDASCLRDIADFISAAMQERS